MNGNKTISGRLTIGVEFNGKLHRDFVLRLPTVGDEIEVSENDDVPDSGFRVALFSRCLISLGTIPQEALTYELLCSELESGDFSAIVKAADELKKKRANESGGSTTTAVPACDSDDTASVKSKSAG